MRLRKREHAASKNSAKACILYPLHARFFLNAFSTRGFCCCKKSESPCSWCIGSVKSHLFFALCKTTSFSNISKLYLSKLHKDLEFPFVRWKLGFDGSIGDSNASCWPWVRLGLAPIKGPCYSSIQKGHESFSLNVLGEDFGTVDSRKH